ncbi:MAG: ABC transporter permease [Deltaproteobacteria bacterium]
MLTYLAKKILQLVPVFVGITAISFFVIHLAPGKPSDALTDLNPKVSLEVRERLERLYGLDKPLGRQFIDWSRRLARFDFGVSFADGRPVMEKVLEALPVTLLINAASMALILGLGIPLGVLAAVRQGTWTDRTISAALFLFFAMPTFWLALLLMDAVGVKLGWLPVFGLTSIDHDSLSATGKIVDIGRHLVLPVAVSTIGSLAGISRYVQENMARALRQPFVLACRSRALPERSVVYKHALRNALLPVITILGLSIPGLVSGSVIFESIFAIPGTGRLFYASVMARDYPVIMAMLVLGSLLTLCGNFLADLGYAVADPRIRYPKHAA